MVWQAIKAACEAILDGDKALALAILDASCISVEGESVEHCYDELGRLYDVPPYLFTHPRPPKKKKDQEKEKDGNSITNKSIGGKDGCVEGVPLTLQVRVNPGEMKMEINATSTDTVSTLKSLVEQQAISIASPTSSTPMSCESSRQRVMFLGKELKDDQNLGDVDFDGNVVQIFLRPVTVTTTPAH